MSRCNDARVTCPFGSGWAQHVCGREDRRVSFVRIRFFFLCYFFLKHINIIIILSYCYSTRRHRLFAAVNVLGGGGGDFGCGGSGGGGQRSIDYWTCVRRRVLLSLKSRRTRDAQSSRKTKNPIAMCAGIHDVKSIFAENSRRAKPRCPRQRRRPRRVRFTEVRYTRKIILQSSTYILFIGLTAAKGTFSASRYILLLSSCTPARSAVVFVSRTSFMRL